MTHFYEKHFIQRDLRLWTQCFKEYSQTNNFSFPFNVRQKTWIFWARWVESLEAMFDITYFYISSTKLVTFTDWSSYLSTETTKIIFCILSRLTKQMKPHIMIDHLLLRRENVSLIQAKKNTSWRALFLVYQADSFCMYWY